MEQNFIFIDGSYYLFYRFHALQIWWKNANKEEELGIPIENNKFVEKFEEIFVKNIQAMSKKLKINKNEKSIIIVGKDCKRENIWRNEFYNNYKANRVKNVNCKSFFTKVYDNNLFQKAGVEYILEHPKLEADDCIAITVNNVLEKYPKAKVFIITSDKDYLQLAEERVNIYNLTYKKLTEQKSSYGDSNCDLFCKIVMGDISDNIKPVLSKCGIKTAIKCFENKAYFEERLKKEDAYELYNINKKIIDFREIPYYLQKEFSVENNILVI